MNLYPHYNPECDSSNADDCRIAAYNDIIDSNAIMNASLSALADKLVFRPITSADMPAIWNILKEEPGRTTDFSYGGVLMWVDVFKYEYAILNDTLFIKGRVENDISTVAFSLPVGAMDLTSSIAIFKEYCRRHELSLIFSAVPEYALDNLRQAGAREISPIDDMADYLYSAESLSTLSGKKYGKKRNHVNQFLAAYPDWSVEPLTPLNADEALRFMDEIDAEGDNVPMAVAERKLNREVLRNIMDGDAVYMGIILRGKGEMLGFTVGDIKGDTLFVHIEKALREAPGAFEMINKTFAAMVTADHPEIKFINREDDSGDMGLRLAKQSYHPVEMLKKYNVLF